MLNPSALNSNLRRSVNANALVTARSKFQAPGPRNAFLPVMLAGYGPKSETATGTPFKLVVNGVMFATGKVSTLNSLIGSPVSESTFCTGVPVLWLLIGVAGTYRGIPNPAPAFREFVVSKTENGTPVRAVNTPTMVQPPATCRCQPVPFFHQGTSQIGETTIRCRMSKSELPQSSRGFRGSR